MMIGYCTLDDYLQLQLLLQHEQRRRERAIQHHLQHHGAIRYRNAQQYRLARAMHNLKTLKESYRRARAYQIQRYMEHYRNQALVAAAEDAFLRPCLALAIEQRRADAIRRQREQDKGIDEDVHARQLSSLLRLLFDRQLDQEVKQQEQEDRRPQPQVNDDSHEAEDLWRYITDLQQQDQEPEEEEEEPDYEDIDKPFEQSPVVEHIQEPLQPDVQEAMQERLIPHVAQEPVSPSPPAALDNRSYDNDDDEVHDAVDKVLHRQTAQAKEPEAVNVIDNRAGVPEGPYMEDINPHEYDAEDDPPLDGSVLDLKDLLNELVSDSSDCASPAIDEKPEDDSTLFAPKDVVTAAEPTPQQAHAPIQNQDDGEDFVHKIAEQQKQNRPPADPAKYEQLQEIDRQLENIRANRQAKVLSTPLHFQNKAGSLQLTATTPQNREFLGCEDEIMKNMLRLDTIDSNGDEGIRSARKALVKTAEAMLEQLDEHKQHEWERVRKPTAHHHKKKKNRRPRHHHNKAGGILVG